MTNAPTERTWVPDRIVNTIVGNGADVYAAGNFTRWGESSGCGVPLNATSGLPVRPFPKVNGYVLAVTGDGSGGWFIGGDFNRVGGLLRKRLAHILADGAVDPAWNPEAGDTVRVLTLQGGILYAGGDFGAAGGIPRERLAALDPVTGAAYSWNPGANGTVRAIAASAGVVYVGGDFTQVGGTNRNYVAAIDAATGRAASWDADANKEVYALALGTGVLYAGGWFTAIGGQSRKLLAALDAISGAATVWDANITYGLFISSMALTADEQTLYIGGGFGEIDGVWHQYAAALDASTGQVIPWSSYIDNTVLAVALSPDENTLYVGGNFPAAVHTQIHARNCLAAIDLQTDTIRSWDPSPNWVVLALASQGNSVYAGGWFDAIGSVERYGLAMLDTTSGAPTRWNPDIRKESASSAGSVQCMALSGETLYIGGGFCHVGSACRTNIAAVDTKTGLATAWNPSADFMPRAMTLSPNRQTLYVGGHFTEVGGLPRNHLAAIDAVSGTVGAWNPQIADDPADSVVLDLACPSDGQWLYVAGTFTTIGGAVRHHLAKIDTTTGTAASWNPAPDKTVYALALSPDNSTLYIGGIFTNIGEDVRQHIAAFDTATGVLRPWDPSVSHGYVYELAVDSSGTVYIAGEFYTVGGQARLNLAAVDGVTGIPTEWSPAADHNAYALAPSGDTVFVGGDWFRINWDSRPRFAQFGEQNFGSDSDADGLGDAWERGYFGDLSHDGTSDWDCDGLTDGAEQTAGTDPTNALSVLRFESLVHGWPETVILSWQSVSGRQYGIRTGANLLAGLPTVVADHLEATPPMNVYTTATEHAPMRFYRVHLEE